MALLTVLAVLILQQLTSGTIATTFTITNTCNTTIWPGILSSAGSNPLGSTGFELQSGGSVEFQAPLSWSGRFWGRSDCVFNPITGLGSCLTGDCGSNKVECNGNGAKPPATLAEFTVGSPTGDYYDVSLVDGFNLPILIETRGGSGSCNSTGCITDINKECPMELRIESGQGCMSACEAFHTTEYCCSGDHATPATCKPSKYANMFKLACPQSYSYAYDDATSTFTCSGADYTITFCPSSSPAPEVQAPIAPITHHFEHSGSHSTKTFCVCACASLFVHLIFLIIYVYACM